MTQVLADFLVTAQVVAAVTATRAMVVVAVATTTAVAMITADATTIAAASDAMGGLSPPFFCLLAL